MRGGPDVEMREVITDKFTHHEDSQDGQEDLPILATVSLIVLASLVFLLLSVLAVIVYYKYQKRKLTQPMKAINRLGVYSLIFSLDDIF